MTFDFPISIHYGVRTSISSTYIMYIISLPYHKLCPNYKGFLFFLSSKKEKKHYPTLINGCEPFPFFAIDKKPRNGRSKT